MSVGDFIIFCHCWRLAGDNTERLESPVECGRLGNYAVLKVPDPCPRAGMSKVRPAGQIRPSVKFYPARSLVMKYITLVYCYFMVAICKNFLKLSLLYVKKVGPHHFYNRKSGSRRKKFGHPCPRAFSLRLFLNFILLYNSSSPITFTIHPACLTYSMKYPCLFAMVFCSDQTYFKRTISVTLLLQP